MLDGDDFPAAVDAQALAALAGEFHDRTVLACGTRDAGGHLVKVYGLRAPGREVTDEDLAAVLRLADSHLRLGAVRGSLGLAVLILHAGGDGDYVLVHTWIEGYMSDMAMFSGPAGRLDQLRPARTGLGPCVWEAAILAHERMAFSRHLLSGSGLLQDRVSAWAADSLRGEVRLAACSGGAAFAAARLY
ncbi:MAG: hypothetical protein ACRDN0_25730 [Trebonia sp.]